MTNPLLFHDDNTETVAVTDEWCDSCVIPGVSLGQRECQRQNRARPSSPQQACADSHRPSRGYDVVDEENRGAAEVGQAGHELWPDAETIMHVAEAISRVP